MNIGWIGLGKMGVPMARHIMDDGHSLYVWNRTTQKEDKLTREGAQRAFSPEELTKKAEVIFVMISDDDAVHDVFSGDDGILAGLAEDKIIVNTSTISPDISKEMAQKCRQHDAHYVDAPVSGSVPQAEGQTLVSIVGGDQKPVKKVTPLLQCYSKKVVHIGESGSGNAAKLAVNMFLGIVTEGLAEVIGFVKQLGVSPQKLMEILNNSALHSPFVEMKGQAVLDDDYEAAFTLEHLAKDLRLAKASGFEGEAGTQTHELFQQAEPDFGQEDVIAIIKYLQENR